MRLRFLIFACAALLQACGEQQAPAPPSFGPADFVGSATCGACHERQSADWQGSHHQLAMQVADESTVLGDFSNATFEHFGTRTEFAERDGDFIVTTTDVIGEPQSFAVEYVFGVAPLQQYLVSFPNGRLQTLPFSWDARPQSDGGQRWYHVYGDQQIPPDDQLHWTGREQNWNYMCAECHSTNVDTGYEASTDSYDTTWSEISVGCESCHGPGSLHIEQANATAFDGVYGLKVNLDDRGRAIWQMNTSTGIAERSEFRLRPPQQPETCGRCHARRGVIASSYVDGKALMDTHRPALLEDRLYYADGQIRDEVYVWGSFLQSRMYRAGVSCSDCHDPHSLDLVTGSDTNLVCGQCHLPSRFATIEHRGHEDAQVGCVDCHMTSRTYMGVDDRRDHSFRIPRPDLSTATESPNACNGCHDDQSADWAAAAIRVWHGDKTESRAQFATAIHAGRRGHANSQLVDVINNPEFPGIARATALTLLRQPMGNAEATAIQSALRDGDSLIRMAALSSLRSLPPDFQGQAGSGLLADPIRAVRIEAASVLAGQAGVLPAAAAADFERASGDFREAQETIGNRPEAHAALGNFELSLGNTVTAIAHYLKALDMEPRSTVARANLADAYRQNGDENSGEQVLRDGLALDSTNGSLRHALGLLLVRDGRHDAGLEELRLASEVSPDNGRYVYVHAIALNSLGQSAEALDVLRAAKQRFPGDFDISWALATMLRDNGNRQEALMLADEIAKRFGDNPNVSALRDSLLNN